MSNRKYTPIQIIGTQRSGSNLLRLMLNELEGVIAPHPPHILKTFKPLLSVYADLEEDKNFYQLIEDVCQLVRTNPVIWENIDLDVKEIAKRCESHTLIEVFRVVYDLMAEGNNATHWCCKSMANVKFACEIETAGMKPLYIRLVRDGRDVAASFKNVAVGEKHPYHLAHYWKELQVLSKELIEKVGHQRALTIKYEDLISEPVETMKTICEFIGLPYSSRVLHYFESTESIHTAESGFMWENVRKPILKNNKQKFKTGLTPFEIETFETVAGQTLLDNGYVLETELNNVVFSKEEIELFDEENSKMKKSILLQEHLKTDLSKRKDQESLIKSIKARRSSHAFSLI